jgi:hypothetical protein
MVEYQEVVVVVVEEVLPQVVPVEQVVEVK